MRQQEQSAARASPTAVRAPQSAATNIRSLVVALAAAALMTLTEALGTDELPVGTRLVYWLVLMLSGALLGIGVSAAVRSWGLLQQRPWLEGALVALGVAVPVTLVVLGAGRFFLASGPLSMRAVLTLFLVVLAIAAAITAIHVALDLRPAQDTNLDAPAPELLAPVRAPLSDRLPRHLQHAAVLAVQAEDHYLRVHTDAGSHLILMRLADAVPELVPIAGARTHRSWWVARDAVAAAERRDGRGELQLKNGVTAPVSRSAYPELRKAGWFD
jgi:DNA-binding LytR/AlgR family response regulator